MSVIVLTDKTLNVSSIFKERVKLRIHLKSERLNLGLKQSELAKILNITERQYNRIEAGTSDGSVKFWKRASKFFNKSIDYLLEQADDNKS